jgi:hypothetical protein
VEEGGKVSGLAIDFDQVDLFEKLIDDHTKVQQSVER